MSSPLDTLTQIEADLDELEAVLLPLMSRPWTETLDALEKPLERARMNSMAAFGICDMIWVFLRIKASATREAIDFETHPVMKELITIQGYHRKIREIEFPPKRTQTLDLPAARRFISHSIPQNQRIQNAEASSSSGSTTARNSSTAAPRAADEVDIGRHTRFRGIVKEGDVERVRAGEGGGEDAERDGLDIVDDAMGEAESTGSSEESSAEESDDDDERKDFNDQNPNAMDVDLLGSGPVLAKSSNGKSKAPQPPRAAAPKATSTNSKAGKRRADLDVFADGVDKYVAPAGAKGKKQKQTSEETPAVQVTPPPAITSSPSARKAKQKPKK